MRSSTNTLLRWGIPSVLAMCLVTLLPVTPSRGATGDAESGIVCTGDTAVAGQATFSLTARDGYVHTPDGNSIYMWSYSPGSNAFQLPGPVLCVNQGDKVTVVLNNTLKEDTSIVFPGQDNVTANGAPAEPRFNGTGGALTSLTNVAPANGGSVTYSFVASQPGTYIYESGTDPAKQVQMGLAGALIVRPRDSTGTLHANWAYNDPATQFNPATEYIMLLSEVDPGLHLAVERGQPYDITAYHPRYWMINGRSFPDTIAPNGAPWLPTQPYSALVHIQAYDATSNPDPALVRYLNVGMLNHPFHPHGNHGRVIGRDGRELRGPSGQDLSYEKFLVLVGTGQTFDVTYNWHNVRNWSPTNPIPVTIPQLQNLTFKDNATWYSGTPYLGYKGNLPVGVTSHNDCGEYYQVWHSHALNEATNYDQGFGGMLTLERIDPLGGCQ